MAKEDPVKAARRIANEAYPKDILYLVFSVVAATVAANVYSVLWALWRRRQLRRAAAAGVVKPTFDGQASIWRLPSAVLTASRIVGLRWRIPSVDMSVLEVVMTIVYTAVTLIFTFVNTQGLQIKGYANRTGHIAAAHYPVIVALAMKNNVIGWFTGLGHEKLSLMHRVMARVMLLQVWIHGASRFKINRVSALNEEWRVWGLVAGVAYTLMVLLSFAPIRHRFYEFFFITHFILALINIVFSYIHAADPGFGQYIWPCFVIWGFDRGARALRTALLADFSAPIQSPATVEVLSHDTLRVSTRRHVLLGWSAGQHMFLSFPTATPRPLSVLEGHPFTISTIADSTEKQDGEKGGQDLVFIMRVRSGLTRRLHAMAVANDGQLTLPLFLNGPYGAQPTLTPYSTCMFVAGGSGISFTLPRMRELLLELANGKACATRVMFVWAVRRHSHIAWLASELRKAVASAPSGLTLNVAIYVSGGASPSPDETTGVPGVAYDLESGSFDESDEKRRSASGSVDEKHLSVDEKHRGEHIDGVQVFNGRPDVARIIEETVRASTGSVSIDVSGPESLVKTVRNATSHGVASPLAVLRGAPSIVLNVETFSI